MGRLLRNSTIQIIIFMVLVFILEKFTWDLIFCINTKLINSPKLIFITPGTESYKNGMYMIISLLLIDLLLLHGIMQSRCKNRLFKMICYVSTMVCIISFCFTCINISAIYENKIYYRGMWNLKGKTYSYSDIKSVNIYVSTGKGNTGVHYELIMKDKVVINLISKKDNYKFIPQVEKHINKNIPHTICSWDYKYLKREDEIPYKLYKNFKVTD